MDDPSKGCSDVVFSRNKCFRIRRTNSTIPNLHSNMSGWLSPAQTCVARMNLVITILHNDVCSNLTVAIRTIQDLLCFHTPNNGLAYVVVINRNSVGGLAGAQCMSATGRSNTNTVLPVATPI